MFKRIAITISALLVLLIQGCGGGSVSGESGSPEQAATEFFYAIYRDQDLDKVASYATPKLARIVKGYGSIQGVTRNMLNMYFDKVEIEVDKGRNLRENYGDKATITLIFTGSHKGGKVADMRTVKMVRIKGEWLVETVKADPFAR